jgi:endoribonuclease Dicer
MQAITHRNCADSVDYERYELLGDAFLKFATANHLYRTKEGADEGILSLELHMHVSNGTLWRCAMVRSLHAGPVVCCSFGYHPCM